MNSQIIIRWSQGLKASVSRTLLYFINMHVDRLADNTIIVRFYWNAFIIYQFCVFLHGKLFAVAFKIFTNIIHKNVISFFKNLYVSMLRIVRRVYPFKQINVSSCMTPLRSCANVISFLR